MKIEETEDEVVLRLSRRNLLTLLHKVEMDGSVRTITRPPTEGAARTFTIIAELDPDHYADRVPGPVHPLTEEALRA